MKILWNLKMDYFENSELHFVFNSLCYSKDCSKQNEQSISIKSGHKKRGYLNILFLKLRLKKLFDHLHCFQFITIQNMKDINATW